MNSKREIRVIIPAINEAKSIAKVIGEIPEIVEEIIVVDNGSSDATSDVAKKAGAIVLLETKAGYGHACLKGIDYVNSNHPDTEVICFLDGDFSDYPEQMPDVVNPILEGKVDMVIGSRALGNNEPGSLTIPQVFGNWLATKLMLLIYGAHFTDLGPFRAIAFSRLLELKMEDKTYGWTVEMQVKAAKQKLRFIEVPVNYRKRIGVSKVSGTVKGAVMAGIKIIWTIFKYTWRS